MTWSGRITCTVKVTASNYLHTETQTWGDLIARPGTSNKYDATWRAWGEGRIHPGDPKGEGNWKFDVTKPVEFEIVDKGNNQWNVKRIGVHPEVAKKAATITQDGKTNSVDVTEYSFKEPANQSPGITDTIDFSIPIVGGPGDISSTEPTALPTALGNRFVRTLVDFEVAGWLPLGIREWLGVKGSLSGKTTITPNSTSENWPNDYMAPTNTNPTYSITCSWLFSKTN